LKKRYFLVFLVLLVIPIQEAIAVNEVSQVIKVTGSLVGGVEDEDFLLPTAVTDQNKTIIFMSVRHLGDSNAKEVYRSWDFVNNTAIRFHGSNNVPASNIAMDFVAYLVEFTATSDMIKQNGTLIVDGGDVNKEFIATLSPIVNVTNSFFTFDGLTMDHSDLSWGNEEFGLMRVLNNTSWGYEPFNAPNTGNTEVRFSVIDWNNSNFIIQNGTGSLLDGVLLDTIVPSPAIDRRHTIVLISTQMEDEEDAVSDEYGATATINASNEIEIEREDAICVSNCILNYRWELISFPTTFANVTHDVIVKTTSTGSDVTVSTIDIFSPAVTNFANSIAIGTVHTPMGLGQARDSSGSTGTWDRNAYTIELINATAVNGTANDARNSANITYQVIEFLAVGGAVFNQDVLDLVSAIDLETSTIIDFTGADDTVTVIDAVDLNVILVVNLDDTGTVTDVTQVNITKLFDDAIPVLDLTNLDITKLLSDLASTSDTVFTSVTSTVDESVLDTVTANDLVILNIFKQIDDTTTISDAVDITRILNIILSDTATVNDPTILFKITTAVSGGGGGGSGIPTPQFERIVGLFVESELIALQTTDRINSDFKIQWFGQDRTLTSITKISTEPEFASWLQFSPTPDLLQVQQTIDGSRTINDPARFVNLALDDYVIIAPSISCDQVDRFDALTTPCLDPILYQVPVEFEFTKAGVKFHADHIIMIDARVAVPTCIFFGFEMPQGTCEVAQFGIDNWIWFIIIFGVLYFMFLLIPRLTGKTRNVRRAGSRELESMSDRKVKRKFKRGKR